MAELSPMMQQYLEIKKQHKDEILFYRIGDFYEMFFEDALTASKELDLTLTGKQCGLEERAPMCGVPFHSYEGYVARLIAKGYKVAICEQVEDPAKAKGLVKRDIIRVVTPGTVIESSMLQDDRNNYIASIYLKGKKAGLCFADVSTGTAHITELAADKIAPAVITELCRFHPSEVLMNPGLLDCREVTAYIKKNMTCSVELVEDERYAPGLVAASLESQFGRDWPQTTGMAENGLVRFAMAALLEYLHDTQIKGVERLKTVVTYNEAQFMRLSPVTLANLELTETLRGREKRGTLLWVLDKTSTAMGKRMLRSWIEQPLLSSKLINQRLNAVESLVRQTVVRGDLTDELHYIADMERLMTRTVYGSATPKEIYTLAQTCEHLPVLRQQATACGCPELAELAEEIDPLEDIKARIYAAVDPDAPSTLKDGGVIAKGYHTEVDELRSIRDNTKGVLAQLEARLRQETGIPKLKIGYNHVFGYYIEVSNSYKSMVPETYIRKQTLTSGERYITQELKELESKILGAHERLITLERRLFDELLEETGYMIYLQSLGEEGVTRIENVGELKTNILKYIEETEKIPQPSIDPDNPDEQPEIVLPTLSGFLEEVTLYTDLDNYDENADRVIMMTMHSAKGLEFNNVFFCGAEEGIFPGVQAIYNPDQIEEERRLAYVCITRAKKQLYITNAAQRMIFGQTVRNRVSRFVTEIPASCCDVEDKTVRKASAAELKRANMVKKTHADNAIGVGGLRQKTTSYSSDAPTGAACTLKAGDRVSHKTFGEGSIVKVTPMGGDCLLEVLFDTVGTKKIMYKFAKLTKLS